MHSQSPEDILKRKEKVSRLYLRLISMPQTLTTLIRRTKILVFTNIPERRLLSLAGHDRPASC